MKISKSAQFVLAVVMVMFGVMLVVTSFFVPPLGVIDASVVAVFGEVLTFAGSVIGIDYHYRARK